MKKKKTEHKFTNGGSRMPTRDNLYARVANHIPEAIKTAVRLMKSKNPSVQIAAVKVLLDRGLPVLHSTEINGQITTININRDYVSPRGWTISTSTRSLEGSDKVQSADMAPES